MSRELLLLRHAKSEWDNPSLIDFDRPLSRRGQQAVPKIGHWLHEQGLQPDWIVSSPSVRTTQTVQRICPELDFDLDSVKWDMRIYEATLSDLLLVLADCPKESARTLLVGHNPGLEYLIAHLCADFPRTPDGKLMPTATAARLRLPDNWRSLAAGCGQLLVLQRPRDLD